MAEHPLDGPDESDTADGDETNERFEKVRARLMRSRQKQFGLGGMLFLMAAAAIFLAWMRQAEGYAAIMIPLAVLFGLAVSVTGLIMFLESWRLAAKDKQRLSKKFFRFGLVFLFGGLPGGILLAALSAYLIQL